jgi:sialic acid synthase SpsE
MDKPYLIAEIGVNFYDTAKLEQITPMAAAKKYVLEAKKAGVDAVKFQSYKADTIVSKKSPAYWDLLKEPTKTQYELFQKHDSFNENDYQELYEYCKRVKVGFLSTPFDFESVDYLEKMVEKYKVSSSDLTNIPFLKYIANKGKPILLSIGASYLSEIDEAVRTILKEGCTDLSLLHCVLSYPTKNEDANLERIRTLKKIFPTLKIGYSDHTMPDEAMTILSTAFTYGAEIIEKHFTLDKTLPGNDHYHAGDPEDFRKAIRNFELISTITGKGEITVLESEEIPRREARRSLVLSKSLKKGEIIGANDLLIKRPGTGIEPKYLEAVINRKVKMDLEEDTILTWDMV